MAHFNLGCRCGSFTCRIEKIDQRIGNRLKCYCKSCRRFANQLDHAESIVDEFGGTLVYQIPPQRFTITHGVEFLEKLKLSDRGPDRWYTRCCNTPIANTSSPALPFVGVIISNDRQIEFSQLIGPVDVHVNTGEATSVLPANRPATHLAGYLIKFLGQMLSWKVRGMGKPDAFFVARTPK